MDMQTEVQKIHHQYGVSEKVSYELQKLFNKAIKGAVTEALRIHDVVGQSEQLVCPDCKHNTRMQNGFIWCENDDCGGIYRTN